MPDYLTLVVNRFASGVILYMTTRAVAWLTWGI